MNINKSIRTYQRQVAITLLFFFVGQLLSPTAAYALTSGPSQPEFSSFEPSSTTEMVDPFTGDFTYNIPLFELPGPNGGYPFNLAYNAGITTNQEASWVGLGWSLNPGAITRQVRGLPDEFDGDEVESLQSMKPNKTLGLSFGPGIELFGADFLSGELGFTTLYNNYTGIGYSIDGGLGFPVATGSKHTASLRLGFSLDSKDGLRLDPSFDISSKLDSDPFSKISLGMGYHSRHAMNGLLLGITHQQTIKNKNGESATFSPLGLNYNAPLSLSSNATMPNISIPTINKNIAFKLGSGVAWWGAFPKAWIKGFRNYQNFSDSHFTVKAFGYNNLQNASSDDLMDFNREKDGPIHQESPNLPVPVLTHDIYSVSGQGVGAMFKPIRTDIGVVHDNATTSKTVSGSLGFDAAPASSHLGVNLGLMFAKKYL